MASTYTPNVTAQDALKRHLAEQHVGASNVSSVATVASADAIDVTGLRVAFITGTTTITELTGGVKGQIVTLSFSTTLTVTSSATLALSGGGVSGTDFSATALDTLTLLCTDATEGAQVWVGVGAENNAA